MYLVSSVNKLLVGKITKYVGFLDTVIYAN